MIRVIKYIIFIGSLKEKPGNNNAISNNKNGHQSNSRPRDHDHCLKHNTAGISRKPEKIVNKTTKARRYNRQFLDLCIKTKTLSRFCAHGPCFQMSIISRALSSEQNN